MMEDVHDKWAQLSPAKQALLQKLLQEKLANRLRERDRGIIQREKQSTVPLTSMQQRLWFLDQFEPGNTAYNLAVANRLCGPLHFLAMDRSLQEIVRRHEILRTTFVAQNGLPIQTIRPYVPRNYPLIDLRGISSIKRETEVLSLAQNERSQTFDLARGPLFRSAILRLASTEHVLFMTLHHTIGDYWSTGIFIHELTTLYEAYVVDHSVKLPELPMQYADYALWQQKWLQSDEHEVLLAYWTQQLQHLPILELPTDHPRPPVLSYAGAQLSFRIPANLTQQLKHLSQQEGITLFTTLLAAFQVQLFRYTAQTDIIVGTTIANRSQLEFEQLIGFFANTLVMRTDLSGNPTIRSVLGRVREVVIGALAHQAMPFETLVARLQPERDLSRSPLIQVVFNLFNVPRSTSKFAHLALEPIPVTQHTAKFELTLDMVEVGQELWGTVEYSTDLFEASTVQWFVHVYQTLLTMFVTDAEQRLSDLPLLQNEQRQQILVEWNATQVIRGGAEACLQHAFEAQVARTPDAVAIVCDERCLTYTQLNRRSNQVAHHLQRLGIREGKRVGICMERSLTVIIGLMGILKAGGAYVPLDPAYPQERVAFMAASSAVVVILTCEHLRSLVPDNNVQVVYLDTDASMLERESAENPVHTVSGEHLAYVIFTSGTTGQPKGAGVYHRGLMNLLHWYIAEFGITADDQAFVITSLSFDLTQKNLFAPLLVGGMVCLHASRYHDIQFLRQCIAERGITLLNCTPSMFYPFMDAEDKLQQLQSVRYLFLGGEPIVMRRLQSWLERTDGHAEVVNTYGPTECSDVVAFYRVKYWQHFLETTPPLGRPIANTQLLILDEYLQPVPPTVIGELYVAGVGVGAGYVNDERLTRGKFLPNPFAEIPGRFLYRTGDRARYRSDGAIEYQGRSDYQVKVRGFRIELGEIEAVLAQHSDVRECVVHSWVDELNEMHLVAYVIGSQVFSSTELRSYLRTRLPDYMVPSFFVTLDKLPLTPSGKVDRRALPPPLRGERVLETALREVRTPIEEVVAEIYCEILNLEHVGLHDNFFDLGGHSLLATRVISRLRAHLQIEMSLRSLFEAPTVVEFARRVERAIRQEQVTAYPPLSPVRRTEDLPLSFAQQRIWFLTQLPSGASTYTIPVIIKIQGPLNITVLEKCIQEIVQRHESLRTTFTLRMGQPVQIIQETMPIELKILAVQQGEEQQRMSYVLREIARLMEQPFDLQRGPLLRIGIFSLQRTEHIFFLLFHHIVFDGWSIGVLLRELSALYDAFLQGKPSSLSPLPIQYVDFAYWQRKWLQGEALTRLTSYWKEQLRGATALELSALTRPGIRSVTNSGAGATFALAKPLSMALRTLSRKEETTLFTTLLAAFQLLLYRSTGQHDIVVGTDVANRTHEETEDLIGFFVNLLALRTQFRAQETFRELLRRVRSTVLNAYAHQDLPFDQLVDELQLERVGRKTPLINVLFVWQDIPLPPLCFQGLELSLLESEVESYTGVKFDLAVFMMERDGILAGFINYRSDLFTQKEIVDLSSHFEILLRSIVDTPDLAIEALEMLTPEEQRQRLISEQSEQDGQRRKLKTVKRRVIAVPEGGQA